MPLRVGRAIERLGFLWYEDPLNEEDIYAYVKLRQKLDIPIMATEYPERRHRQLRGVAHRARHRLPARRHSREGRPHHHAQDRAPRARPFT